MVKQLEITVFLISWMALTSVYADTTLRVTEFLSSQIGQPVPNGWEFFDFPGIPEKTTYEIIIDQRYDAVIHAHSRASAGGLVRPINVRADTFSTLSWIWKIDKTINGSIVGSKNGDDFPARLLVSFKDHADSASSVYDNALCYVWADREPVGTFVKNPFHDHVMTIVVANNGENVGEWLELSRNVVNDYIAAFGRSPQWISAVTLMTDSDNTRTETQAWYGPIEFTKPAPDAR